MPTLAEWDSWLETSRAKYAPYEVPEAEREQAIAEGDVGQYPGDNPDQFLKSGRQEFTKLKTDRLALTDQVKKARSKEKELHPRPKLERFFDATIGKVPSFLSPDVAQEQPGLTPDTVVRSPVQPPAKPAPSSKPPWPSVTRQTPSTRFQVEDGEIVDTKNNEIISQDQFAMLANPQEKAEIDRQLQPDDVVHVPEITVTASRTEATPHTVGMPVPEPVQPKPRSPSEAIVQATNNFFQGGAEMASGALKSIAIASKDLDALMPEILKDPRKVEDRFTYKLGNSIDRLAKRMFPSDPASQKDFIIGVLPRALGSMTTFLAGGVAGAAVKAPGTVAAILGAGAQGASQYEEAGQFNADEDTKRKAFWLGTAVGSSEAFSIPQLLRPFNKATGGMFFNVLKKSGVTAAIEAAQEWGQQVGSNAIAQQLYDENRSLFENAGISSGAGGASGAIVGLVTGIIQGRKTRKIERNKGASESPFAGEPTLRQTPLNAPQPVQQEVQPIQQPVASPYEMVGLIPQQLNIQQRAPFLIKQPVMPSQMDVAMQKTGLVPSPPPVETPAPVQEPIPVERDPYVQRFDALAERYRMPTQLEVAQRRTGNPIEEPIPFDDPPPPDVLPTQRDLTTQRLRAAEEQDRFDATQALPRVGSEIPILPGPEPEKPKKKGKSSRIEVVSPPTPRVAKAVPSVEDIHTAAEANGIPWDNNQQFMDLTEEVTGERHLDDLTGPERAEMVEAIDAQAHEAASSPTNDLSEPTEGQKEAGNYKKGHARIAGLDISIENPEGSTRSGTSKDGTSWKRELTQHYGYIRGAPKGKDGDFLDVFVKPTTPPNYDGPVFVVDQIDPDTGKFDETKTLIGYDSIEDARQGYLSNYTDDWNGLGNITQSNMADFKQWLASGKTTRAYSKLPAKEWVKPAVPPTPDLVTKDEPVQMVPTPDTVEKSVKRATKKPEHKETPPTPDLVLTAPQSRLLTGKVKKAQDTQKADQLSIDVPPSLIGDKPIIGREAQPEEAPLFSKAAQAKEPEQTELPATPDAMPVKTETKPSAGKTPDTVATPEKMDDKTKPASTQRILAMTEEEAQSTIDRISSLGEQRRSEAKDESIRALRPTAVDWLNADEMEELNQAQTAIGRIEKEGAMRRVKEKRAARVTSLKQRTPPSKYAFEIIDRMYRSILDDTKVVHHMRRDNKEAWATVKRVDTIMKEWQKAGLDYDEAAGKVSIDDLDKLSEILDAQEQAKEQAKAKADEKIKELGAPDRSAPSSKKKTEAPSSSASELADLFKQESAKAKKAVRQTQPRIPIDPLTGGASIPVGQIILDLEKGIGKKLTVGKVKPGLAGVYRPGSSATMIKYSGDLDTTAHEMSHALDDQYGLVKEWKGQDTSPFDAELEPFSVHGSSGKDKSPTYNRAEGVAEYLRAWLVNPSAAEAAAPQFTKHVKDKLPAPIQKALTAFSTQIRQWHGNTAHAKIMANVQWETPETGLTQWLAGSRTAKGPGFNLTFGDQMATALTDRLAPFMKALKYAREQRGLDKEQTLPGNDPALLSRLFMGVNAKLDDIFAHGMVNSQLERATPGGLSWLMEPLNSTSSKALDADMQEVASLMIAQRTIEKAEQLDKKRVSGIGAGIEEDMSVAESRLAELKKDEARYAKLKEAASRYRQWADANLRYLVDKGRLSQGQYESIKANNEQYVAMQRILEVSPGEELAAFIPRGTSRKLGAVGQPVKTFEGSTRTIKNPYLSLMDATHRSIREADRNEIMKLFRDLLTTDRGLYEGEPTNLASVGREAQTGEQQTIPIFVNGTKEVWQFHPDVYKALKGIEEGTYKLPPFLTILPRILRATIVNTPAFALRNVIRDAWQRSIASLSGSKPWDTLKVYSKEEIAQLKKSGGDQAGHYYTDSKNYARAMKFAMEEAVASHNSIVVDPSKLVTWAKKGGQGYLDLMQGSERQGRLSEYRRAFRKAQKKFGYDDYHAMLYAAAQARGLIDYAVAGNTMTIINQLIPFSNAAVQGLRSNLLRAKADPAGFALRFGAFALVPTLMNYAWNYLYDGDDLEEYRQLPAYQRDLFWNFKLGPDLWLKVPKPFELGVMASSFERTLDYANGNAKAFDGHVGAMLRTILPVDDASLAGPYQSWVQAATNYDFFRDRPIIPNWENNLALDLRNYHRASRLGQALQQAVGVDARKIDFLLQSQFGYVGRYAVDVSDTGRKDKHGLTLSATGVTGGSPASVSLDAKAITKIADERGVVPSRSKAVDRVTNMAQITAKSAKHPDSLRYAVFRKHVNEYYKAESREERDRLAKQVRADAKHLRDLWEKTPPRPEADDKIKKKRAIESEHDPFLDLMGYPQPISKHPTTSLHELVP